MIREFNFVVADYALLTIFVFKIIGMLCGMLPIYLGYKLFDKGAFKNDGELSAEYKDGKLFVKSIAPGVFFALLGAIIILSVIISGYDIHISDGYQGTKKPDLP